MSYNTILTYLPESSRAKNVLNVAVPMAEKHQAHLIGLHVIPEMPVYGTVAVELSADVMERQRQAFRKEAEDVKAVFEEETRTMSAVSEWRCDGRAYANLAYEVSRQTQCADIAIIGQAIDDPYDAWGDLPSRLVMDSGRPVLLIPSAGSFSEVGKRVMLAWNETRESARAAFDALPLMQHAEHVRVLAINPGESRSHSGLSQSDDLAVVLARHGVNAEAATSVASEISVGDELLSRAADDSADLIVMGCYGHSRLRETIFGGVTKRILASMTVPVLMSH